MDTFLWLGPLYRCPICIVSYMIVSRLVSKNTIEFITVISRCGYPLFWSHVCTVISGEAYRRIARRRRIVLYSVHHPPTLIQVNVVISQRHLSKCVFTNIGVLNLIVSLKRVGYVRLKNLLDYERR